MADMSHVNHGAEWVENRRSHEPPAAVAKLGWRYHHVGIPTAVPRPHEMHLPQFGMFVSGFNTSPYGIEWMRFESDSPLPELIKTVPHIAFEVDDLDLALQDQEVIFPPGSPSDGARSAMIVHNGAPVELIAFRRETQRQRICRAKAVRVHCLEPKAFQLFVGLDANGSEREYQ